MKKKSIGTMNIVLIVVAVLLIVFTISMLAMFYLYQCIPDTLCTCVFAALGGECGIMGWIRTTKDKLTSRKWQLEDAAENKMEETENDYV